MKQKPEIQVRNFTDFYTEDLEALVVLAADRLRSVAGRAAFWAPPFILFYTLNAGTTPEEYARLRTGRGSFFVRGTLAWEVYVSLSADWVDDLEHLTARALQEPLTLEAKQADLLFEQIVYAFIGEVREPFSSPSLPAVRYRPSELGRWAQASPTVARCQQELGCLRAALEEAMAIRDLAFQAEKLTRRVGRTPGTGPTTMRQDLKKLGERTARLAARQAAWLEKEKQRKLKQGEAFAFELGTPTGGGPYSGHSEIAGL